ncbi:hypothetical protein [Streptomyces sp. S.PB5]|nr:hypothetical protein [Streptomyces sp. S.PB5]MDN3029617.1 hypothetical protein [Streptomyces sp. S.PB5]
MAIRRPTPHALAHLLTGGDHARSELVTGRRKLDYLAGLSLALRLWQRR